MGHRHGSRLRQHRRGVQVLPGINCIKIGLPGKLILSKVASIYDVRTEGRRGVSPKEDVVREVA